MFRTIHHNGVSRVSVLLVLYVFVSAHSLRDFPSNKNSSTIQFNSPNSPSYFLWSSINSNLSDFFNSIWSFAMIYLICIVFFAFNLKSLFLLVIVKLSFCFEEIISLGVGFRIKLFYCYYYMPPLSLSSKCRVDSL